VPHPPYRSGGGRGDTFSFPSRDGRGRGGSRVGATTGASAPFVSSGDCTAAGHGVRSQYETHATFSGPRLGFLGFAVRPPPSVFARERGLPGPWEVTG